MTGSFTAVPFKYSMKDSHVLGAFTPRIYTITTNPYMKNIPKYPSAPTTIEVSIFYSLISFLIDLPSPHFLRDIV